MRGIFFEIEGIYFLCFRKTTTTSIILSYSIPPFTTIRGFLANCLGMPRFPDYKAQLRLDAIKIGIQPLNITEIERDKIIEMCKLLKLIEREAAARPKIWGFPSTPMFKELLQCPKYKIFLVGDNGLLREIDEKIQNPERPLYLGQSDDMVDILNVELVEVERTKSENLYSIVEGIYEGCEVVKLPYKFSEDGKNLKELTVSVPRKLPLILDEEVECYKFRNEYITAY